MTLAMLVYAGFAVSLAVFLLGMALCFIALWQNRRARPNQYLALTSLGFGAWAIPNGLYYVIDPFNLHADTAIAWGSTVYALAFGALFFFITELNDPEDQRIARQVRVISVLWIVVVIGIIWSFRFWTKPTQNAEGLFTYAPSTFGAVTLLAVVATLIYIGARLRHSDLANHVDLVVAMLPLLVGLFSFAVLGAPNGHFINSIAVLVTLVMVSRVILQDQLFNPLLEMYNELSLRNKELEIAGRRKSEFLANMSHELRTPLNSIIGYTELIIKGVYGDMADQQVDRLEKVLRNGKELLNLINDVLDLSKIDAGRLDLEPVHMPTPTLIDEVIATLEGLAREKNLKLVCQYENLPTLFVDKMRARQAILNILANLIKFTLNDHSITINGYLEAVRHQVVLSLRVGAGGLTKPDMFKIMQAIQQNDELPAEQFAEFGLGLAVSQRLVELHGGRVWFDEGHSAFHISFPAAAELVPPPAPVTPVPLPQDDRPLVLVVDDDPDTIEVLRGYLKPAGYRIFSAQSGHEGVLRARELKPHLITLDIQMPVLDGWGVVDMLKADDVLKNIPVIIISVTDQSHMVAPHNPLIQVLTKPVNRHVFLTTVEQAIAASPPTVTAATGE